MIAGRRYSVTRLEGFRDLEPSSRGGAALPGVTFHVVAAGIAEPVALHRSEDVAIGLPHAARIRVAEIRANRHADRLELKAAELLEA